MAPSTGVLRLLPTVTLICVLGQVVYCANSTTTDGAVDPKPTLGPTLPNVTLPSSVQTSRPPASSSTSTSIPSSSTIESTSAKHVATTNESSTTHLPPQSTTLLHEAQQDEHQKPMLLHSQFKWNSVVAGKQNSLTYKLNCTPDYMSIEVNLTGLEQPFVYLEKLRSFSICKPKMAKSIATFHLALDDDFYRCGTIKVHDQLSGTRIYYNRVIVESKKSKETKSIYFKCSLPSVSKLLASTSRTKRETNPFASARGPGQLVNFTEIDLPDNFMEAEILDFDQNITARAPYPHLGIRVKRNGQFVNTSLNVAPGTPLEMVIHLDDDSKHVYGLLASFMKVTDGIPGGKGPTTKEEVIVLNGCSIDPYIFGNFESDDNGDSVSSKFRAFKFPESSYVMFVGTVNVCLDKCLGVPCGNDIVAHGRRRRRRSVPTDLPKDPNKVFEIEMVTYLQIGYTKAELEAKHAPSALQASYSQSVNSNSNKQPQPPYKPARLTSSSQSRTPHPVSSKLYDSNGSVSPSLLLGTTITLTLGLMLQKLAL